MFESLAVCQILYNTHMAIINTEQRLCGNFHAPAPMLKAYIPCWPFNASMCSHCDDVGVDWNPVKMLIWDMLIGWWWDGAVLVKDPSEADPQD